MGLARRAVLVRLGLAAFGLASGLAPLRPAMAQLGAMDDLPVVPDDLPLGADDLLPPSQPLPDETVAALKSADLLYVATKRKNGERSSIRPIWFDYHEGHVYFTTSPSSWKARRIKRGSPLFLWIGSETGPFVLGRAQPVTDPAVITRMGEAYSKKYWLAWLGFFRPNPERVAAGKTVAYRVSLQRGKPPPAS